MATNLLEERSLPTRTKSRILDHLKGNMEMEWILKDSSIMINNLRFNKGTRIIQVRHHKQRDQSTLKITEMVK